MSFFDDRIIQAHQGLQVQAQRFEIMFRDGSALHLHPVVKDGQPAPFLRAFNTEGLQWSVFDVRLMSRDLEADILRAVDRDRPGLVYFHLRAVCPTAQNLIERVRICRSAHWWKLPTEVAA